MWEARLAREPAAQAVREDSRRGTGIVREWMWMEFNDPSAGSPTETLLRLLLPLNGWV